MPQLPRLGVQVAPTIWGLSAFEQELDVLSVEKNGPLQNLAKKLNVECLLATNSSAAVVSIAVGWVCGLLTVASRS